MQILKCLAYLGWELITPSLFLEAEKTDVRLWMDQHLVGDIYGLSLEENTYQVEFELFDVLEGVAAEKTSDLIHGITEIYKIYKNANTNKLSWAIN